MTEAYQQARREHGGLHHQHQGSAAGEGAHRAVVGVEQGNGFGKRAWFGEFEGVHAVAPEAEGANAAAMALANCRSISLAFDFMTGWPILPSLPVSEASIS